MLVVLAVLGLAAAVTLPALAGRPAGAQGRAAARDLVSGLRVARAEAIATNRPVVFTPRGVAGGVEEGARPVTFFPDGGSTGGRYRVQPGGRAVDIDWLSGAIRANP